MSTVTNAPHGGRECDRPIHLADPLVQADTEGGSQCNPLANTNAVGVGSTSAHSGLLAQGPTPWSEDLAGNPLEPTSPYSWIHRAASRLGWARRDLPRTPSHDVSLPSGIFSYGDASVVGPPNDIGALGLGGVSWPSLRLLFDAYFERAMVTYWFLHMPSVEKWLQKLHQHGEVGLSRHAICLMVLAHGALYLGQSEVDTLRVDERVLLSPETLYEAGVMRLSQEKGAPTVESVQARLVQVHHLLSSSRPNQAWYTFGSVVQLTLALGLHRDHDTSSYRSHITKLELELGRRTFWSVYATDKYISINLGRPFLIPDALVSQGLPADTNDEDLADAGQTHQANRDSMISATIGHARLAQIVTRGIHEQYEKGGWPLLKAIVENREALEEWKGQLPILLTGVVRPSSLIPALRRQAVVLNIFYLHAVILVNRPALICDFSQEPPDECAVIRAATHTCIDASVEIAENIIEFTAQQQKVEVYWFTHNITFNAISILYFHILRTLLTRGVLNRQELGFLSTAQRAQDSLAQATEKNPPCLRYTHILTQLRAEVLDRMSDVRHPPDPEYNTLCTNEKIGGVEWPHLNGGQAMKDVGYSDTPSGEDDLPASFWHWFDSLSNQTNA
ncbi:fungal-specific transcription factor domain-containing protein [Ustulina deusta]|nr:fungal-specific transcription factor domain-containing protein [Ustulina deusta]